MAEQAASETPEEVCPLCGAAAQKGCLLGADRNYLQWFDGPPTFGKNLASALGWPTGGDPVGTYLTPAGAYAEGLRCRTCRRIILAY